jgi:hypothetical protein
MPPTPEDSAPVPRSFAEFWPLYVRAHSLPLTRAFHFAGTMLGYALLVAAIVLWRPWLVLAALLAPYPVVWFSHFFFEHNKPATFGHPFWSWYADQKMVGLMLAGKMDAEVRRVLGDAPQL